MSAIVLAAAVGASTRIRGMLGLIREVERLRTRIICTCACTSWARAGYDSQSKYMSQLEEIQRYIVSGTDTKVGALCNVKKASKSYFQEK